MIFHGTHKDLIDSIEAIGASFAVYEYDPENNLFILISCNSLYEDLIGRSKNESITQAINIIFPRYISTPLIDSFYKCKNEKKGIETEILIDYKAEEKWWRSILSPIIVEKNNRTRIIQTCVDITEKKKLANQLNVTMKRYKAVVETAYDGIVTIDEDQNIKLLNNSANQIFGISDEDLEGMPLTELIPHRYRDKHPDYVNGFKNSLVDARPMQTRASVRGLRRDGTEFPIEVTISKIKVKEKIEMTAVIRDISEKNKLLEELLASSQEDPLTSLYNRRYFTTALSTETSRLKRYKRGFILMMIDIDFFKKFNDKHGHDCGDQLLIHISKILKSTLRETDIISRWGGEEFLILLPETPLEKGLLLGEKLRTTVIEEKMNYGELQLNVTLSMGIKYCEENINDIDEIIKSVDTALYKAKENGRNRIEKA